MSSRLPILGEWLKWIKYSPLKDLKDRVRWLQSVWVHIFTDTQILTAIYNFEKHGKPETLKLKFVMSDMNQPVATSEKPLENCSYHYQLRQLFDHSYDYFYNMHALLPRKIKLKVISVCSLHITDAVWFFVAVRGSHDYSLHITLSWGIKIKCLKDTFSAGFFLLYFFFFFLQLGRQCPSSPCKVVFTSDLEKSK